MKKSLVVGILNLFTFMSLRESMKLQEHSIQPETCFGKLRGWMSQGCPNLALTLVVWKTCKSRK